MDGVGLQPPGGASIRGITDVPVGDSSTGARPSPDKVAALLCGLTGVFVVLGRQYDSTKCILASALPYTIAHAYHTMPKFELDSKETYKAIYLARTLSIVGTSLFLVGLYFNSWKSYLPAGGALLVVAAKIYQCQMKQRKADLAAGKDVKSVTEGWVKYGSPMLHVASIGLMLSGAYFRDPKLALFGIVPHVLASTWKLLTPLNAESVHEMHPGKFLPATTCFSAITALAAGWLGGRMDIMLASAIPYTASQALDAWLLKKEEGKDTVHYGPLLLSVASVALMSFGWYRTHFDCALLSVGAHLAARTWSFLDLSSGRTEDPSVSNKNTTPGTDDVKDGEESGVVPTEGEGVSSGGNTEEGSTS